MPALKGCCLLFHLIFSLTLKCIAQISPCKSLKYMAWNTHIILNTFHRIDCSSHWPVFNKTVIVASACHTSHPKVSVYVELSTFFIFLELISNMKPADLFLCYKILVLFTTCSLDYCFSFSPPSASLLLIFWSTGCLPHPLFIISQIWCLEPLLTVLLLSCGV